MTTYTLSNRILRVLQQLPFADDLSVVPKAPFYYPLAFSARLDLIRRVAELSGKKAISLEEGARPLIDLHFSDLGPIKRAVHQFVDKMAVGFEDTITTDTAKSIADAANSAEQKSVKRRNNNLLVALNDVTFTNHDVTLVLPPNRFESFDKTLTQAGWNRA